jgi:quercetin dioxygenase-like cupin family protein
MREFEDRTLLAHWDEEQWGALTEENIRRKFASDGYSAAVRYIYPPGTSFHSHSEPDDRQGAVLDGELRLTIGGKDFQLQEGDIFQVPAGVESSGEVVGARDLVLLDASRTA